MLTSLATRHRSRESAEALAKTFVDAGFPAPELVIGGDDELGALLAREDIHAVSVVLASQLQPKFVEAALKAGKGLTLWVYRPGNRPVSVSNSLLQLADGASLAP